MRSEFYYRKITTYPQVIREARQEAGLVFRKLKRPQDFTYMDLGIASLFALQLVGAFFLGEVVGRQNLVGYPVGESH